MGIGGVRHNKKSNLSPRFWSSGEALAQPLPPMHGVAFSDTKIRFPPTPERVTPFPPAWPTPCICTLRRSSLYMSDPSTYWLNIMNIGLGLVVLVCCTAVVVGVVAELAANRKKRAGLARLDREVADLVTAYDGHAFHIPGLGLTMADGGEPAEKKEEKR